MVPNIYVLIVFGLVALGAALGMLLSRNTVYSALFLVVNFATVAFLYLILGAPFIALVQITVYAGSIMVLFLFVIMLLGAEKLAVQEPIKGQRLAGLLLGFVLAVELVMFLIFKSGLTALTIAAPAVDSGSPAAIGTALFTQYALPFEVTGFLLLAATVGAIVFTRAEKETSAPIVTGRRRFKDPEKPVDREQEEIVTKM